MRGQAMPFLLLATTVAVLLLWALQLQHEVSQLRLHNLVLQDTVHHLERGELLPEATARLSSPALPSHARRDEAATHPDAPPRARPLLALHRHWDFKMMAAEMLSPFDYILPETLAAGVASCFENGTMYCLRAQVISNQLYITDYRAIFFDRQYAPSRVMPLLSMLKTHEVPDVDLVIAANDEPRVKVKVNERHWRRTCETYPGGRRLPPPLFSSTTNRGHLDLPWLDFSFFMPRVEHKLRTPPWSELHPAILRESASIRWEDKIELAMHTGNVGSPFRKRLAETAAANPGEMLVNELFIGDHNKIRQTCEELQLHRKGGFQQHKCYMKFSQQCSYKYLLNSASIGYANKLKYLLLCGSVVIYVQDGMAHKEFYEYGLLPGIHYVSVPTAADVPSMVRWLRQNDQYARAVARAGRERLASLDNRALADFLAELLRGYAKRQKFQPKPLPGAVRIECEDDLWRHYSREQWFQDKFILRDNSTCIRAIPPGTVFRPPGWGGAYNGSKPRCVASHDLRSFAQPKACLKYERWLGGESMEPFGVFPTVPSLCRPSVAAQCGN
ncbi:hypothetical protein AB1Y20_006321 [Prymnesium parvum]|uniref:Glycosyl transferase CAP10 domain-containing protein n=1 Tax=Prymnesium parvum TaxID=97485 RepID=A0AB34J1I3_PRYPA